MPLLAFPDDMYCLRPGETPMYGHEPMVKRYVEHLKEFVGAEEWVRRRDAAALQFYRSLIGEAEDPAGKGRFFCGGDTFAWYLFLGEAFNDHPQNYEVVFGCRVIPIFSALGRNLENLRQISGYEDRLRRLVSAEKAQPNGGFFEFLVAAAYVRDGYRVSFRPELPGKARTHDIDVEKGGVRYAIECKRMEGGEYNEKERQRMRELWGSAALLLSTTGKSVLFEINFKTELANVPDIYMHSLAKRFCLQSADNLIFDDEIGNGNIRLLDIKPLQKALKKASWLHPGPQYNEKLLGSYRRYENLLSMQKLRYASNPHFVDDLDQAVVARWTSLSEQAIERKARDVHSKIVEAHKQLPSDTPGIIHVGFETLGGDEIEKRRYDKIKKSVTNFDALGKPLEVVFCHYFSPEASPSETWAFDETCHWHARRRGPLPLSALSLVIPEEMPLLEGVHWNGPAG